MTIKVTLLLNNSIVKRPQKAHP